MTAALNDRLGIVFDPDAHLSPGPLDDDAAAMLFDVLRPNPRVGGRALFEVVIYSNKLEPLGLVNNYESAEVEFLWNQVGTGEIVIPAHHEFAKLCMSVDRTVVPITVTYNDERWSGRVDIATREGVRGQKKITLSLIDDYAWFHAILAFGNPRSAPEVQFPPQDIAIGPIRTVIDHYLTPNAKRLGLPITMLPFKKHLDTTEWVVGVARMVPLDELFQGWLDNSSCRLVIRLWLPGDPQPHPDLYLTKAQYLVEVVDNPKESGVINTQTFLDGLADALGQLVTGFISQVGGFLIPGLADAVDGLFKRAEIPSVVWSSESSGVANSRLTVKHPLYYSVVVGGKSPTWLNELVDMVAELAVTWVFALLSMAVLPGLSGLLASLFKDVFLAFQKFADQKTKADMGILGFPEGFANAQAGYTFAANQVAERALNEGRGQRAMTIEVMDGYPFLAFYDYHVGSICGLEDEGEVSYDRCRAIKVRDSRSERVMVSAVIGDDRVDEDPSAKNTRLIKGLQEAINFQAVNV